MKMPSIVPSSLPLKVPHAKTVPRASIYATADEKKPLRMQQI